MGFAPLVSRARHALRADVASLLLIPLVGLVVAVGTVRASDEPSLADILDRTAKYVEQFERDFGVVISDEVYKQRQQRLIEGRSWATEFRSGVFAPTVLSTGSRELRSEMLFTWIADEQSWLCVRNVLEVDGRAVPDSKQRLDSVLAGENRTRKLRELADEGARFNLGRPYRNLNDPTLVLRFLEGRSQPRFAFKLAAKDTVNRAVAWKIMFTERERPAFIQNGYDKDLLAEGSVWVAVANGALVRTELTLHDSWLGINASIVVDYRREPKLDMWVPSKMAEDYRQSTEQYSQSRGDLGDGAELVHCEATYTNFRRFETSGRLVTPK